MPLIDLSDAVNVVEGYRDRNPDSWSLCNSIKFDIAELPTISPDEVRGVGKWIDYQQGQWVYAQCSECGTVHDVRSNYCPSCGARMEVSEDTRKN